MQVLEAPVLDEFHQHLQLLGDGGSSIDRTDLANWCVDRAAIVSPSQVKEELTSYIAADELEVFEILLLASVHIDAEYDFQNGVKLTRVDTIPNSQLAQSILIADQISPLPLPSVSSVMVTGYSQPRFHWSNVAEGVEIPRPTRPIVKLRDTQRALALSRPQDYGIQSIASGTVAPDHYPIVHSVAGWSVHSLKNPPLAPSVLEIEMRQADEILNNFEHLNQDLKAKLRISMDRLNGYASRASLVDRAIDLRICLESIFLHDGNKEQLRHTLALRAARYLGDDLEERKQITKTIKSGYDLTSTMVHTGKIPKKDLSPLDDVAILARKAILKLIEDRHVDWDSVELGNA